MKMPPSFSSFDSAYRCLVNAKLLGYRFLATLRTIYLNGFKDGEFPSRIALSLPVRSGNLSGVLSVAVVPFKLAVLAARKVFQVGDAIVGLIAVPVVNFIAKVNFRPVSECYADWRRTEEGSDDELVNLCRPLVLGAIPESDDDISIAVNSALEDAPATSSWRSLLPPNASAIRDAVDVFPTNKRIPRFLHGDSILGNLAVAQGTDS